MSPGDAASPDKEESCSPTPPLVFCTQGEASPSVHKTSKTTSLAIFLLLLCLEPEWGGKGSYHSASLANGRGTNPASFPGLRCGHAHWVSQRHRPSAEDCSWGLWGRWVPAAGGGGSRGGPGKRSLGKGPGPSALEARCRGCRASLFVRVVRWPPPQQGGAAPPRQRPQLPAPPGRVRVRGTVRRARAAPPTPRLPRSRPDTSPGRARPDAPAGWLRAPAPGRAQAAEAELRNPASASSKTRTDLFLFLTHGLENTKVLFPSTEELEMCGYKKGTTYVYSEAHCS